jgi:hypothetical protein
LTDGVAGLIFSGVNIFGMGLRHGWKPLGRPHTITGVKGNVIKTIEGKPAVAIYEEYFGKSRKEIEKTLIEMSIYYPLGLYVPGKRSISCATFCGSTKTAGSSVRGTPPPATKCA